MTRVVWIDTDLIGIDTLSKHKEEIEYKYLTAYTNINNIRAMLSDIRKAIRDWEWDEKSLSIALEENENQLASHIKAIKLHKKNILFIKNL